jgi:translation initiation factor 2B subunit (eIF-2B alpha/beta/delta family)
MADIARLTGPRHGQRTSKRDNNAAAAAKRRAAINTARAALPAALEILQDAKKLKKEAQHKYNYYGSNTENRLSSAYNTEVHAGNYVDRLKQIAAGNYKNTDILFLPKIKPSDNVFLSPANRQALRIKAAKNARITKGWFWGGTRRMRKMTRRVR